MIAAAELQDVVQMVLETALSLDARLGADCRDARARGRVRIEGDWRGSVSVACSTGLARQVARRLYPSERRECTREELSDALGELTNMIGGNLKTLLPGRCHLSLPEVELDAPAGARARPGHALLALSFSCQGEPLEVRLDAGD